MKTTIAVNGKEYNINEIQLFGGGPCDSEDIVLRRRRQIDGLDKWSVHNWGMCLNKDGDWEFEPLPSSRDAAYLERCRFDTPEEALSAWHIAIE